MASGPRASGGRSFSYNPQESMTVDYAGGGGGGGFMYSPSTIGGGATQVPTAAAANLIRTSLQQSLQPMPSQQSEWLLFHTFPLVVNILVSTSSVINRKHLISTSL